MKDQYKEPATYNKMIKLPLEEREKLMEGVKEEFANFDTRKVWKVILRNDVPHGRKLVGTKWVFKRKRDGRHHARLVALGYTQIPGVDYTDNFAPVSLDVTLRIVDVMWILNNWDCNQLDAETAFLEKNLEPNEYQYL